MPGYTDPNIVLHPTNSPDPTPLITTFFKFLQNYLKNFNSQEACKNHLNQFIINEDAKFGDDGNIVMQDVIS